MSITFDNSANLGAVTASSLSGNLTVGSAKPGMLVGAYIDRGGGNALLTGGTANGVDMQLVATAYPSQLNTGHYLFFAKNPAPGSVAIVLNASGGIYVEALAISYLGVSPYADVDAAASYDDGISNGDILARIRPFAVGSWAVMYGASNATLSAGVGTTLRQASTDGAKALFDSGGALTEGEYSSLEYTLLAATLHPALIAALTPAGSERILSSLRHGRSRQRRAGFSVSSPGGFF